MQNVAFENGDIKFTQQIHSKSNTKGIKTPNIAQFAHPAVSESCFKFYAKIELIICD